MLSISGFDTKKKKQGRTNTLKNYSIKIDLDTLAEVWILFEECGAEGLLVGRKITADMSDIIGYFIGKKKLVDLCKIITGMDDDFGKVDFGIVAQILSDFFGKMGEESAGLFAMLVIRPRQKTQTTPEKQTSEKPKPSKPIPSGD